MSVQNLPVDIKSFVKGLVTEAGPLTFPDNASIEEQNFVLNADGTRDRRLGFDLEESYEEISPQYTTQFPTTMPYTTFNWKNVGGDPDLEFIVVHIGSTLQIFDTSVQPLSSGLLTSIYVANTGTKSDMAYVDGDLVVVNNQKDITIISYDDEEFSTSTARLKIRDTFGVEDIYEDDDDNEIDLSLDENLKVRPDTLLGTSNGISDAHLYNLRNQSWGRARIPLDIEDDMFGEEVGHKDVESKDPIEAFYQYTYQNDGSNDATFAYKFPANGDVVGTGLMDDTEETPVRTKFCPGELGPSPLLNSNVPKGFFVIDALNRGASRTEEYANMMTYSDGQLTYYLEDSLPTDSTYGGASCVAEYGGRIWYGGFSSRTSGGDSKSPRLSSYIMFSQFVTSQSRINLCYQLNDPTYEQEVDLLDTDGGMIKLNGAYGIKRMAVINEALVVFADNGVWMVRGSSGSGFSATSYEVTKITDRGCASKDSVVVVDSSVFYWAESGIYMVSQNEYGEYYAQSITSPTIQSYYNNIGIDQISTASGVYDSYDLKIRWVYRDLTIGSEVKELVYDVRLQAFYTVSIGYDSSATPVVLNPIIIPRYTLSEIEETVRVDGEQVQVDGEDVVNTSTTTRDFTREVGYLVMLTDNEFTYTFASYRNLDFLDWYSIDSVGLDAEAYFVTGYVNPGDFQRRKQVPYLTVYLKRTEDGFEEDDDGDLVPTGQSSCYVQSQWDWTNSANSNRWSSQFQAYRYNRLYFPEDGDDDYDTGDSLVVTRNKLRGKGRTLSLKFSTEAGKDCRIVGWSMVIGVSGNV